MNKERIVYIDLLRVLAIVGVILIHVTAIGLADYPIGTTTWTVSMVYSSLARWCVPVFFMISGAVFLGRKKVYTFEIMIKKYIPRLLIYICFWGFFYSLLDQYIYGDLSVKSIIIAVWGILSGHTGYHMWFLYSLMMLYLMVPVFQAIIAQLSDENLRFLLILWLFFSLGIGQINQLISELGMGVSEIVLSLPVISGYAGYFLLGYYLYNVTVNKKDRKIISGIAIASCILGSILNVVCSIRLELAVEGFTSSLGLNTCIVCIALFLNVKEINFNEKNAIVVKKMGANVLGVYLVHVFFNSFLFRVMNISLDAIPIVGVFIFVIIIFVCSYIVTYLLKKIPGVNKVM